MRRKLPSTAALAAFEAAARHQSFTRAAEELALTQSAVCRQVAGLEDFVGVELFRRTRRGVVLTEAGAAYGRRVRARLEEVERDALELMSTGGAGGVLELGVLPTFAAKWLLPRLRSYLDAHPGVTVNLTPRTRPFLFEETELDATIYAGESGWPGTEAHFLLPETLIAVGSPALRADALARRGPAQGSDDRLTPAELAWLPRLQISTRPQLWRQWFEHAGLELRDAMAGSRMELFSLIVEAAVQGLGVALVPRFLIEAELSRGLLVQLLDLELPSDRAYWLIVPQRKAASPLVAGFREWLVAQAGATGLPPSGRSDRAAREGYPGGGPDGDRA